MCTHNIIKKRITVGQRHVSLELEGEMWNSLDQISIQENTPLHLLCHMVHERKPPTASLASAIHVFVTTYMQHSGTAEAAEK